MTNRTRSPISLLISLLLQAALVNCVPRVLIKQPASGSSISSNDLVVEAECLHGSVESLNSWMCACIDESACGYPAGSSATAGDAAGKPGPPRGVCLKENQQPFVFADIHLAFGPGSHFLSVAFVQQPPGGQGQGHRVVATGNTTFTLSPPVRTMSARVLKRRADRLVRSHYEVLPYPPIDVTAERAHGPMPLRGGYYPVEISDVVYGGRRKLENGGDGRVFRALVAGGGTGSATVLLAKYFSSLGCPYEVVHLDLSAASIGIARQRVEGQGLRNVSFVQGSIIDVAWMGLGTFDFINCVGVLHHLDSPELGLKALEEVLAEDGGMYLMLYGTLGRTGVYDVQRMMAMLYPESAEPVGGDGSQEGHEQPTLPTPAAGAPVSATLSTPEDAETAAEAKLATLRQLLATLPTSNRLAKNKEMTASTDYMSFGGSGLYDLFLHSTDRPFTLPQVQDWLAGAGMRMQLLLNQHSFGTLSRAEAVPEHVAARLRLLPHADQMAFGELLWGNVSKHMFFAVKNAKAGGGGEWGASSQRGQQGTCGSSGAEAPGCSFGEKVVSSAPPPGRGPVVPASLQPLRPCSVACFMPYITEPIKGYSWGRSLSLTYDDYPTIRMSPYETDVVKAMDCNRTVEEAYIFLATRAQQLPDWDGSKHAGMQAGADGYFNLNGGLTQTYGPWQYFWEKARHIWKTTLDASQSGFMRQHFARC
eukprot:jgi/Mesvir1/20556/Mv06233-RA.1